MHTVELQGLCCVTTAPHHLCHVMVRPSHRAITTRTAPKSYTLAKCQNAHLLWM